MCRTDKSTKPHEQIEISLPKTSAETLRRFPYLREREKEGHFYEEPSVKFGVR
jgi:hypothetical protein